MNYTLYILGMILKLIVALILMILIIMSFIRTYQYDKKEWQIKNSRVKKVDTKLRLKKVKGVKNESIRNRKIL